MSYANMDGVPTQTAGTSELLASDWNTYVRDNFDSIKFGHVVCTSSTRPTGIAEGTMIYETDTNKVLVYNGSSWVETNDLDTSGTFPGGALNVSDGSFGRGAPVTKTGDFSVGTTENWLICNKSTTITVTLPSASTYSGREVMIKNINTGSVVSNASNVIPIGSGTAGTDILPANYAGGYATLVSNGTNWVVSETNIDTAGFFGAWTSYTPTFDQGASTNIAKTVDRAKYLQIGKVVIVSVRVTFTASGTAGSVITMTVPKDSVYTSAELVLGSCYYFNSTTNTTYIAAPLTSPGISTNKILFVDTASTTGALGSTPSFAIASNHRLSVQLVYEIA